jgi:hypothetical protein
MIIVNCKKLEGKSKYCPSIYLDKLTETIKVSRQNSLQPARQPHCVSVEHSFSGLLLRLICSSHEVKKFFPSSECSLFDKCVMVYCG